MMACGDVNAGKLRGHIWHGVPILGSSNEAVKIDGIMQLKILHVLWKLIQGT